MFSVISACTTAGCAILNIVSRWAAVHISFQRQFSGVVSVILRQLLFIELLLTVEQQFL